MREWTDGNGRKWRAIEAGGFVAIQKHDTGKAIPIVGGFANGGWVPAADAREDKKALWTEILRLDAKIKALNPKEPPNEPPKEPTNEPPTPDRQGPRAPSPGRPPNRPHPGPDRTGLYRTLP